MAWTNEAYRAIEITDGVDAENSVLADWLALNAEYEGEISTPEPEITDLTGTKWVFIEHPSLTPPTASINFTSNGNSYTSISQRLHSWLKYGDTEVYADGGSWANQAYRIIEITGGTDVTSSDLISWLMANATLVPVTDLTNTKWTFKSMGVNSAGDGSATVTFSDLSFKIDDTVADGTSITSPKYQSPYVMMTCAILITTGSKAVYYFKTTDFLYSQLNLTDGEGWYEGFGQNVSKMTNAPTIEFVGGTGATNPTLIAWLQENATLQDPTPLYDLDITASHCSYDGNVTDIEESTTVYFTAESGYHFPDTFSELGATLIGCSVGSYQKEAETDVEIVFDSFTQDATLVISALEDEPTPEPVNKIKIGNLDVSKILLGSNQNVDKMYLGQILIYESAPSAPSHLLDSDGNTLSESEGKDLVLS